MSTAYPPRGPSNRNAYEHVSPFDDGRSTSSHTPLTTPAAHHQDPYSRVHYAESSASVHQHHNMMDSGTPSRPDASRGSSYDVLSRYGGQVDNQVYVDPALVKKSKLVRFYSWLINVSLLTRWLLYILPVLGLVWIPGILGLTAYPNATVLQTKLIWWSIWLSVIWAGWWAALLVCRIIPGILRYSIGIVAIGLRKYIDWMAALHRYIAFLGWAIAVNVSFLPLIYNRKIGDRSDSESSTISFIQRILFASVIAAAVLVAEKLCIQIIAYNFHERSYAERIADQKTAIRVLVTLYRNSHEIGDRTDTLRDPTGQPQPVHRKFFKSAIRGVRDVAQSTTSILGNVASEITGSSVLQPTSPEGIVTNVLTSANKSRLLARRIYYSFKPNKRDALIVEDIARFFPDREAAEQAFTLFDKDLNGDANREEVETACMECHREQLSIANSMKDLDSAVGRLDSILMVIYYIIVVLIFAVAIEAKLSTLLTGYATFILGLSWLIGGSLQEVLTSIIFLFVKHPYDVGDRVDVDADMYTVKEIRLLSTVFISVTKGCCVQVPHSVLNGKSISNIRRSPQMSEPFNMDVSFGTTFEQIEKLRAQMLAFVKEQRRDFLPQFDVIINDIPEQSKMILATSIKYKSNFQQGALKARRKNMWICALKQALSDCKIYGPSGDPGAPPGITHVTMVPYNEPEHEAPLSAGSSLQEPIIPRGNFNLQDKNAVIADDSLDVYGERDELHMTNPRPTLPRPRVLQGHAGTPEMSRQPSGQVPQTVGVTTPQGEYETIEMGPTSSAVHGSPYQQPQQGSQYQQHPQYRG